MTETCGCATFTCRGTYIPGCRKQELIDMMMNQSTAGSPPRRRVVEEITIKKAHGRRDTGGPLRVPDHGTAVSAIARDGKVIRSDGKPHRP